MARHLGREWGQGLHKYLYRPLLGRPATSAQKPLRMNLRFETFQSGKHERIRKQIEMHSVTRWLRDQDTRDTLYTKIKQFREKTELPSEDI